MLHLLTYLLALIRWRHYLALATPYRPDVADFTYPLPFSALVRGDPSSNLWKSFTVPETRVFQAADGEDLVILAGTAFD